MWRRFWHRDDDRAAVTNYGQTIERMAATDDPAERVRLGKLLANQLELAIGRNANTTQVAIWHIEDQWRGILQEQLGATNEMISDVLAATKRQEAAVVELRITFQQTGEALTQWQGEVDARLGHLETGQDRISHELEAMNARHERQIEEIHGRIVLTPSRVLELVALIEKHEALLFGGEGVPEAEPDADGPPVARDAPGDA